MLFVVFHCQGSFLSEAHTGKRKALQVQALEECALYHGVVHPNTAFDGQWAHPRSLEDGKASKYFIPPSKIVDRGGGAIPRCRCGGCGHGGGCSEMLALVKTGLEPTDSSVKLVLTQHFKR
jgi:hypothetical protein